MTEMQIIRAGAMLDTLMEDEAELKALKDRALLEFNQDWADNLDHLAKEKHSEFIGALRVLNILGYGMDEEKRANGSVRCKVVFRPPTILF